MAAADKVKQFRTAVISVLSALLGFLGLTRPSAGSPAVPAAAGTPSVPALPAQPVHAAAVRDRALPPTIKQRIRAEAHGASPSVRHLPAAAPMDGDPADRPDDLALAAA
ncbi:DUF6344 domain-containing protein [Streptomyces sp. NPDC050856]|uniref:DUF6344 domain-containing protein n=1 Tax=Streptomyces sp. NPDC050856 TaxID=3154939 RepID=UPI0033FC57F2